MYRCEACNTVVPPRTPAQKVVLETRPKTYRNLPKPKKAKKRRRDMNDGEGRFSSGTEIVHEALLCGGCAANAVTRLADAPVLEVPEATEDQAVA